MSNKTSPNALGGCKHKANSFFGRPSCWCQGWKKKHKLNKHMGWENCSPWEIFGLLRFLILSTETWRNYIYNQLVKQWLYFFIFSHFNKKWNLVMLQRVWFSCIFAFVYFQMTLKQHAFYISNTYPYPIAKLLLWPLCHTPVKEFAHSWSECFAGICNFQSSQLHLRMKKIKIKRDSVHHHPISCKNIQKCLFLHYFQTRSKKCNVQTGHSKWLMDFGATCLWFIFKWHSSIVKLYAPMFAQLMYHRIVH